MSLRTVGARQDLAGYSPPPAPVDVCQPNTNFRAPRSRERTEARRGGAPSDATRPLRAAAPAGGGVSATRRRLFARPRAAVSARLRAATTAPTQFSAQGGRDGRDRIDPCGAHSSRTAEA